MWKTCLLVAMVTCVLVPGSDALTCSICSNARFLEDCTAVVHCSADEICFMEQVITDSATIEYSGGCRSKSVCNAASQTSVGRRSLIACSRCCDTDLCGDNLCGLQTGGSFNSTVSRCYSCGFDEDGSPKHVSNPAECDHITTCEDNEMCESRTVVAGGAIKYEMGCKPKNICLFATQHIITEYIERCSNGRCTRSDFQICGICCGDSLCNNNDCKTVLTKLILLKQGNNLDINSLRTIRH